jgi:AcrR family transcriptional regulator
VPRERALEVAGRLFYEQGVRATGVAEVIAAIGCGKQALYRLFPSKDDLVAAYLEVVAAARERSADEATRTADDPADQLVALTAELAGWTERAGFRGCAMRNYLREYPTERTKAGQVAEAYLRRDRERILALATAVSPDAGEDLARKVSVVHEGLYGGHAVTGEMRAAAVALVADLVVR